MGILNTLLNCVGQRPTHRLSIEERSGKYVARVRPIESSPVGALVGALVEYELPERHQPDSFCTELFSSVAWKCVVGGEVEQWARSQGFHSVGKWAWKGPDEYDWAVEPLQALCGEVNCRKR